jgi:outer membrane protein OmpA-like peptidoglycan-associated protein/Tol biopolymer transport system component
MARLLISCHNVIKLILVTILFSPIINAQKIIPTSEDIYAEAGEYVFAGEYNEALPLYLQLYDKGFNTANINFKIGECYLKLPGQKDRAIPYLENAVKKVTNSYSGTNLNEENAPVRSYLYLGLAYQLTYNFDKAKECYNSLLQLSDTTDNPARMLATYYLKQCDNAEELIKAPADIEKEKLPENINNIFPNTRPLVITNEQLIFYINQFKFYDAVMQAAKTNEKWQEPVNITPLVKSDGDHLLTGISADGNILFFTAYDPLNSGDIYVSKKINNKWTPVIELNDNINTVFNETHASLSPDGHTLYFTSDRKGGYGGLDIYKSELIDGDWGPAVNLGPVVNTMFDEESPFVSSDGQKLFFSSKGHYNMGGYDIFYSQLENGNWMAPVNIGYPVNTPDDDLFYFPVDTGSLAYISVIDRATRQSDIFRIKLRKYANPARYTINGKVDIEEGNKILPADIQLTFIEKSNNDTIGSVTLNNEGKFEQKVPQGAFNLNFSDKEGKIFDSKELYIPPYFAQDQLVFNTTVSVTGKQYVDTLYITNILFAFDKSNLTSESILILNALAEFMIKYPQALLLITGHTDAMGSEEYNMKLSVNRAAAVASYLKKQNINPIRLAVNGLGESAPIALNTKPDGTDNPDGRALNRRVELQLNNLPENWIVIKKDNIPEYLKVKN